jgi:ketosteroid isomerase-like protein
VSPADRAALSDLVARYALEVDRRHLDRVAALFTEDGVLLLPAPPASLAPVVEHRGRAAVRRALEGVLEVRQTFHALLGEVYDVGDDPGEAVGFVAGEAHHLAERAPGDVVDRLWRLRYQDTYRHTPDGWRIARRELHLASIENRAVRAWVPSAAAG